MTVKVEKNWRDLPTRAYQAALAHVEVYLDKFIGVVQGGPYEWKNMTHQLFRSINNLFQPNGQLDVAREELISLNDLA